MTYKEFTKLEKNRNSAIVLNQDHVELRIATAEAAFATHHADIAREVLENYFRMQPQKGSYYIRAKLCLALVLDHEARNASGDESIKWRKLAAAEAITALVTASDPSNAARYRFLVFNSSVVLWHIVHRFVRPGRARFFVDELQRMSAALEAVDDADKAWRVMYLSATAFALEDADNKKAGSDILDKAIDHAEKEVSAVVELEKSLSQKMQAAKEQSEALMLAQRTIEAREELMSRPKRIDPDSATGFVEEAPATALPELTGLAALAPAELKDRLDDAQAVLMTEKEALKVQSDRLSSQTALLTRLYLQRVHIMPADTKRVTGAAPVMSSFRASVLVQLQSVRSGAVPETGRVAAFQQMLSVVNAAANPVPAPVAGKKGAPVPAAPMVEAIKPQLPASVSNAICETLLDMSRCAWALGLRELAVEYSDRADRDSSLSPAIRVKSDLCRAIRMVAEISTVRPNEENDARLTELQREGFANGRRIEALKLLERVIGVCSSRLDDPALLQEIAIVVWNTAVPLLQPHLRQNVYRAFQLSAGCLEDIASPLVQLRAQLHLELAKCEEQNDFVVKAKAQTENALHADYGGLYEPGGTTPSTVAAHRLEGEELDRRRPMDVFIKPLDTALSLRSSVYDTPEDIESQVMLVMQQVAESKSRSFQADSLFRSLSALQSIIEKPDNSAAANAILGNGSIPPPISKLKAAMTPPGLDELGALIGKFGSTAALATPAPVTAAPAKGKAAPAESVAAAVKFSVFTELIQTRLNLMYSIARTASRLGEEGGVIVQRTAAYILNFNWNPDDRFMRSLILQQIDVATLLTEALVIRIAKCELSAELNEKYALALEGFSSGENEVSRDAKAGEKKTESAVSALIEPMCLGVVSPFATAEMQQIKSLVIKSTAEALKIALRVKDDYSIQNGIVFFWNLHLHVFRRDLFGAAMPEMLDFLKLAHSTLLAAKKPDSKPLAKFYVPAPPEIDFRLRVAICEGYSALVAALSADVPAAIDIAVKGCAQEAGGQSAYIRRRLCEHASRLAAPKPALPVDPTVKGAPKTAGVSTEPLKFDDPFLNIFGALVFAEAPGSTKESVIALVAKIRAIIDGDLAVFIGKIDIPNLTKEQYDQLLELRACALTRLTRLYVSIGDVYGAYAAAEQCTKLIESSLASDPETQGAGREEIVPRVWRWMSLCERYFGSAVSLLIRPQGQEIMLQNELRVAALRHYTLSAQFGRKAREDGLVVDAGTDAWNATMPLIDVTSPETLRPNLRELLYMILNALEGCTEEKFPEGSPASKIGRAADDLKQRFYLAIIEGLVGDGDWDGAMKAVLKAFECIPPEYHRPIWKLRVVVMSKRGKSALDGIQKLKEGDASLQARVYAVLARSASIPAQQLEAYAKAVEVMATDAGRVEYILEMVQYLASSGVPKSDVYELLLSALDALSVHLSDPDVPAEDDEDARDDDETSSKMSGSVRSKGSKAKSAKSKAASVKSQAKSVAASKAGTKRGSGSVVSRARTVAGSVMSVDPTANADIDPNRSNLKHLDYAMRSLAMMVALENKSELRLKRSLETVYFVERSISLWNKAMELAHRRRQFLAIPPPERKDTDFGDFACIVPPALTVPTCSVDLLLWTPGEEFETVALAAQAHAETALDIPSTETFSALPLTVHYLNSVCDVLVTAGFLSSAILCLAWARAVLMLQTNRYQKVTASSAELEKTMDPMHAAIYYKAQYVLKLAGLEQCARSLSKQLGRTERTITSFLHSFSEEAAAYIAGGNHLSLASSVTNKELTRSDQLTLFGFHSFTSVLPGSGFDKKGCALEICQLLFDLSSFPLCRSLLNAILPHCQRGEEHRNVLIGSILLARLESLAGRHSNALALLSGCSAAMELVGDSTLLSRQAVLLVRSYCALEMLPEALITAHAALGAIDSAIIVQLPDVRPETAKTRRVGSAAGSVNGGQTIAETATIQSGTSASLLNPVTSGGVELSQEGAEAYVDVCLELIRVLQAESTRVIYSQGQYPINQLGEIDEITEQCILRIGSVDGQTASSLLYARLLEAKVRAIFAITMRAHAVSSFRLDSATYHGQMLGAVQSCVDRQYEACEVYRALLGCLPAEREVLFLDSTRIIPPALAEEHAALEASRVAVPPAGKDAKKDPKAKEPIAVIEPTVSEMLKESPSGVLHRAYGDALVVHADMLTALAELKGVNAAKRVKRAGSSGAVGNSHREPTVIDKYLEESAPIADCHRSDFLAPDLVQAALSATSAVEALNGSRFKPYAQLVSVNNMLSQAIVDEPLFDGSWAGENSSPDDVGVDSALSPPSIVAADDNSLVATLQAHLFECIAGGMHTEAIRGCNTLIECYGRRESSRAALFVLLAQSLRARDWLQSIWRAALPDNSEVSTALRRLNGDVVTSFRSVSMPHIQSVERADGAFLSNSSVPYRRLSVAQPVAGILGNLPACHMICISFNPTDGALTVVGGIIGGNTKQLATDGKSQYLATPPGEWMAEKMVLTPSEQRSLQTLRQSQTSFREETLKFVAAYGDQMSVETDCEEVFDSSDLGQQSSYRQSSHASGSSSFTKAEHSIAERFRGIVGDMEAILSPILGSSSRVVTFLKAALTQKALSSAPSKVSTDPKGKGPESHTKAAEVHLSPLILLVDPLLQDFPLEAMDALSSVYGGRIARDYSVHMIGHRAASATAALKASAIRAVVDTFAEDRRTSEASHGKVNSMQEVLTMLTTTPAQFAGGEKWKPVCVAAGSGISLQQWLSLCSDGDALGCYVHVPGKLSSILPPTDLSLIDFSRLSLAVIVDGGNNDASYRRQNVVDNKKSQRELANDDTAKVAALLTLCGVNTVVTTQWGTSFSSQALFATNFWHHMSISKLSVHDSFSKSIAQGPPHQDNNLSPNRKSSIASKKSTESTSEHGTIQVKEFTVKKWQKFAKSFFGLITTSYDPAL